MANKKAEKALGILLVIAGVLIGSGVGQLISLSTGKSVTTASSVTGLGIGFLAAFIYGAIKKK